MGRDAAGDVVAVPWGSEARPGDLLLMDFTDDPGHELPRAWDHASVLISDGSPDHPPDGVLDGSDLVRHMTTHGLADQPLRHLGRIRFRLWRWRR